MCATVAAPSDADLHDNGDARERPVRRGLEPAPAEVRSPCRAPDGRVRSASLRAAPHVKKILVIDDEPSMRELLGIMLRKEGFAVEVAESRATAALALARGPVDLVITDV